MIDLNNLELLVDSLVRQAFDKMTYPQDACILWVRPMLTDLEHKIQDIEKENTGQDKEALKIHKRITALKEKFEQVEERFEQVERWQQSRCDRDVDIDKAIVVTKELLETQKDTKSRTRDIIWTLVKNTVIFFGTLILGALGVLLGLKHNG